MITIEKIAAIIAVICSPKLASNMHSIEVIKGSIIVNNQKYVSTDQAEIEAKTYRLIENRLVLIDVAIEEIIR